MLAKLSPWHGRKYFLDRMTLGDLVVAFFTHHSILVYLGLAALGAGYAVATATDWRGPVLAILAVAILYPFVEYSLHRWVLHARWLYKSAWTAKVWKRIHFDHHQNPHDLAVLFGALYTTLPPIFLLTLPIGWAIGLKYTEGFSKLGPSIFTLVTLAGSMFLLAKASQVLPIGTAYGVWVGVGALGAAIFGIFLFHESASPLRLFFLFLLLVSIIGLKITSK